MSSVEEKDSMMMSWVTEIKFYIFGFRMFWNSTIETFPEADDLLLDFVDI